MAGAEAIMAALPQRRRPLTIGLVLNERGWDRALAAGVDEANVVVCATDGFGIRNQGATVADQMAALAAIAERRNGRGRPADQRHHLGRLRLPVRRRGRRGQVVALASDAAARASTEIALGDTIGVADPWTVRGRIEAVRKAAPDARLRMHFHDTRNTGLPTPSPPSRPASTVLDASCGGLGGCPFAPAATGNIATEDLVYMLGRSGIDVGIDMTPLLAASAYIEERLGHANPALLGRAVPVPPGDAS